MKKITMWGVEPDKYIEVKPLVTKDLDIVMSLFGNGDIFTLVNWRCKK